MLDQRFTKAILAKDIPSSILNELQSLMDRSVSYGEYGFKLERDAGGKLVALIPYFDAEVPEPERRTVEQHLAAHPSVERIESASVGIKEDFEGVVAPNRPLGWHEWQPNITTSTDQAFSGSQSLRISVPAGATNPDYAAVTIFSDGVEQPPAQSLMEYGGHLLDEFSLKFHVYMASDLADNSGGVTPDHVMFAIFPGSFPPPETPDGFTPFVWMANDIPVAGPYPSQLEFSSFGPWLPQSAPSLALPLDDAWHQIELRKTGARSISVSVDENTVELNATNSEMQLTVPPAIYIGIGRAPGNPSRTVYVDDVDLSYSLM